LQKICQISSQDEYSKLQSEPQNIFRSKIYWINKGIEKLIHSIKRCVFLEVSKNLLKKILLTFSIRENISLKKEKSEMTTNSAS